MALTPLDIHNKEFHVKLRGYDQDEVNESFKSLKYFNFSLFCCKLSANLSFSFKVFS